MRISKSSKIVLLAVVLVVANLPASAGNLSLAWDTVPGATGYRVYLGSLSGDYSESVDVGANTSGTLRGLEDCKTHYLAVKAYNENGESEGFSGEISGWPRPGIEANPNPVLMQGARYSLNLRGTNFREGSQVQFDHRSATGEPLVRVESIDVVSCHEIQVLLTVEPFTRGFRAMEVGVHPLRVINPEGNFGNKHVQIEFKPRRLDINRSSADTTNRVDGMDLVWLAHAHGASEGNARYNADADLNGDGFVDGEDLAYLASQFGACWVGDGWTSANCPD